MISTKAKPSCKIHPNKVLREIKINVTIENRSNFWRRSVAIWGKWHWHIWGSQYGIRNCVSYLHVLLHGGDVNFICDLHLVVMAGIQQHLVIELPVPHLTSGILCSLGGVRKGYAHTFKVGLIIYLWSRSTFEADLPLKEILSSTSEAGLPLKQSTSEAGLIIRLPLMYCTPPLLDTKTLKRIVGGNSAPPNLQQCEDGEHGVSHCYSTAKIFYVMSWYEHVMTCSYHDMT